mgnify:CR=1 FL=1|tara:strand:- start:6755 stop:7189 length:435 start_codon:yes stop_codon:yes gene_type:complete
MGFTKVAPAGIGTEPGSEIKVGDSLLHSTGIDLGSGTGIGATITRQGNATFSGIVTATKFVGDGSELNGVSGLGTALSNDSTSPLNTLYYVNSVMSIGSTITIDPPPSAVAVYTNYAELQLEESADLIIESGDVVPDVLGLFVP